MVLRHRKEEISKIYLLSLADGQSLGYIHMSVNWVMLLVLLYTYLLLDKLCNKETML